MTTHKTADAKHRRFCVWYHYLMNSTISNTLQVVAFTAILLGIFFFQDDVRNMFASPKTQTEQENKLVTNQDVVNEVSSSTTQVERVAIEKASSTTSNCDTLACFSQKFARCEPSEFQSQETLGASAYYKIIGVVPGGCSMVFKYPRNPNPNWMNKEMTCTFDNKIDFEKSVQKTIENVMGGKEICSGPLYGILSSLTQKPQSEPKVSSPTPPETGVAKGTNISVSYNSESDSLTITGANLLNESGKISLSYFVDPSSVSPTLKSEMIYRGVMDFSKSEPNPYITVTDTQIEIKKYASVTYCREMVRGTGFENSGKKLRVGIGVSTDVTSSSVTPDVTFEVECRDTTKKLQEMMSM